ALCASVVHKEILEVGPAEESHGATEVFSQTAGQFLCVLAYVPVRDVGREVFAGLSRHFLVDSVEALYEALDVVVAVAVIPNVLDDFDDGSKLLLGRLGGDVGRVSEVRKERAIKAVEDHEVRFIREVLA